MSNQNFSDAYRNRLKKVIDTFVHSELAEREIQPAMWLSVIDFAQKLEMEDLNIYAKGMFYRGFDWDTLRTTYSAEEAERPG